MNPEQGGYNPETERKRFVSFRELFTDLKEGLDEFIWEKLTRKQEDPEILDLLRKLEAGENVGKLLNRYFAQLIPKSLRPPDKEYRPNVEDLRPVRQMMTDVDIDMLLTLREARPSSKKAEYESFKNIMFEGRNRMESGRVQESGDESLKTQYLFNRYPQEGGENIIEEAVLNRLTPKGNLPEAAVTVVTKNGFRISMDEFLPSDSKLVPNGMNRVEWEIDRDKGEMVGRRIRTDLNSYEGTKGSGRTFYQTGDWVVYGDLTGKGGVLSLLHEIAHSWQEKYYDENFGKPSFLEFEKDVVGWLSALESLQKEEGFNREHLDVVKKNLAKLGVEIDDEEWIDAGRKLKEGEVRLQSKVSDTKFIVRTDKFDALLKAYEMQERDAWAHGLRVLRLLRKKGLDLEPALQTLDDIKRHIDPCLMSYQEHTEKIIESSTKKVRFAR